MSSITLIGTGNMARTIGTLAIAGGNTVEVMGRDQAKAEDLAKTLGGGTTTGKWGAVPAGDIVITALLYDGVVPVVAEYGDALAGKVIVDISNPFNATVDGLAHGEADLDRAGSRQGGPGRRQRGEGVQHHLPRCPGEGPARRLHRRRRRAGQGGRGGVRREPRAAPAGRRRPDDGALAGREWAWSRWASPATVSATGTSPSASTSSPADPDPHRSQIEAGVSAPGGRRTEHLRDVTEMRCAVG